MDTALITFMVQTSTSIQSVHLCGSWDNFSKHYPMERDVRRARGQWRGCYAFEDIICDGDGQSSPKRTGGLKMGSIYYYYYELDDGTEHYDKSLPFTTACPYLPGQPVNQLFVPIEVQPLRSRSGSMSSMANGDIKTMNPADKFMTPRQPPPAPAKDAPRPNTSTSVLVKTRSARSLSPKGEKPQWSPRAFFGLRSPPVSPAQPLERKASEKRGRSSSLRKANKELSTASTPNLRERSENDRKVKSVPHTRNNSPRSFESSNPREPAPIHRQASTTYTSNTATIPEEVIEDIDDYNFADQFSRFSMEGRGITPLAPPPSSRRSPSISIRTTQGTSKPLPELPEVSLMPQPLRLASPLNPIELQPRSHFSTSTISSSFTSSPTESHFSFSFKEKDSYFGSTDGDDHGVDASSGDEFTYSPILSEVPTPGFGGYSLPEADYSSEQTIRKQPALSALSEVASRKTFGSPLHSPSNSGVVEVEQMSALAQLMKEMGYLGEVIVGN